jgi:exodeoxyribonuclease V beta subunit
MKPLDVLELPLAGTHVVEASAGTGKTWNICLLVLRVLLERGLGIERILVVTFTNAAAAELRDRIRSRVFEAWRAAQAWQAAPSAAAAEVIADAPLAALLDRARSRSGEAPARLALRLRDALDRFDEAPVATLHGWAQNALATRPLASGQALATTLLANEADLRREVLADTWRREVLAAELPPPLLQHLARTGLGPQALDEPLKRLRSRPLACVRWPEPAEPGTVERAIAHLAAQHRDLAARWPHWQPDVATVLERAGAALNQASHSPSKLAASFDAWTAALAHEAEPAALGEQGPTLLRLTASGLRVKKDQPLPQHPFFDAAEAWIAARLAAHEALSNAEAGLLRRLLEGAPAALRQRLAAQRMQSFDSLLESLHAALAGPAGATLAAALRQRHAVALIDEFQDTDSLQWALFQRLFGGEGGGGEGTGAGAPLLVLVGDPKQAIYAFRNAELATYTAARDSVPDGQRHSLAANQRSVAPMLAALNALFGAGSRPFFEAGLRYQAVTAGAKPRHGLLEGPGAPPRAALELWRLPAGDDGEPLTPVEARACAAAATAAEILRLLGGDAVYGGRPLAAGDIAVLVRSHSQARQMQQALSACGIGAALRSRESVFASAEAEALDALLGALLAPADPVPLKRLLALDCMGGSAESLLALADDDEALAAWWARLAAWRRTWWRDGPAALIRHWQADAGIVGRLLPRADGERRLTNLRHLAELLQLAAQGATAQGGAASTVIGGPAARTPEAQWRWLEQRRREGQVDETRQLRLASDRALVQVMTIHQSKGLEFPVVFLPFVWQPDAPPKKLALPLELRGADGGTTLDFAPDEPTRAAAEAQARLAAVGESQRLIYVAMTRAAARCHAVVGAFRHRADSGLLAPGCRASPLNWLVGPRLGISASPDDDDVQRWIAGSAWAATRSNKQGDAARRDATRLDAAWAALAAEVGDPQALRFAELPAPAGAPAAPAQRLGADLPPPERLERAPAPEHPPRRSWHLTSYSALAVSAAAWPSAAGAAAAASAAFVPPADALTAPGADHDLQVAADEPSEPGEAIDAPSAADDDVLDFPRGASAGTCLHRVFELADFADATQWAGAIERALAEVPLALSTGSNGSTVSNGSAGAAGAAAGAVAAPPGSAARQLRRMLADVLGTPLAPTAPAGSSAAPLRLANVAADRRLVELEFHLPLGRLDAEGLNRLLAEHGLAGPAWRFPPLEGGALRGFIDAIVEHDGRWWVIDWKSNHLGRDSRDYAAERLEAAMAQHGYALQAQLYLLALHRHLARRLPGYRLERHLGGALYLFVRGVRPDWPAGSGVHLTRPDPQLLERLGSRFPRQDPAP